MVPSRLEKTTSFSFSGHETFVFRYGWLKKAYDGVARTPDLFMREDAIVALGVGKNMVRSIKHWAVALGVLSEDRNANGAVLRPTSFGDLIFGDAGLDPFLEDPNTLWLLHWNLLTRQQRCTTWIWAFCFMQSNEFTRESLTTGLLEDLRKYELPSPSANTLKRDVEVFIRTYLSPKVSKSLVLEDSLDCPLNELGLVDDVDTATGVFQFQRGPKPTLSDEIFAYALVDFWKQTAGDRQSLAFSEIAYAPGGPGSVFKLDENSLVERLERLEGATSGDLTFAETAGLKQVYGRRPADLHRYISHYFRATDPLFAVTL